MGDNVLLMRKAKAMLSGQWLNAVAGTLIYVLLLSLASYLIIGELILQGPLTLGYLIFLGCLVDRRKSEISLLFKGFERFLETMVAGLLVSIAIFIGLLLLIVPGIIVACGLSMTFYIMLDDPNVSGIDAIKKSWNMMNGNKLDYFCLQLRFFGWIILAVLTLGIGFLWLNPYIYVTNLNYYRKLNYGVY